MRDCRGKCEERVGSFPMLFDGPFFRFVLFEGLSGEMGGRGEGFHGLLEAPFFGFSRV